MNELKKIRIDRELSQVELGRMSRVHPSRISVIESGSAIPTENEVRRISECLGVVPAELFGLDTVVKRLVSSRKKGTE